MSKFKVEFTLKQHTPIIHFQSDQSGATLRATELKPKFDRFLKKYAFGKNIPKEYKIAIDQDALNYKVKIYASQIKQEDIHKINPKNGKKIPDPLFFGDMGDNANQQKFVTAKETVIIFSSFDEELLKIIKDNFRKFIAYENFGMRQSKGFGSFYIQDEPFDASLIEAKKVYSFRTQNWKNDIKLFYSFLRQGINIPKEFNKPCPKTRFYTKPLIFLYAKSKGWTWDKKAIKEAYFSHELQKQQNCRVGNDILTYTSEQKYLLRDIFGLSTDQSWRSYRASIKKKHPDIARFKSPIHFKVIDNRVFFWIDESYTKILGKEFTIIANRDSSLHLSTPAKENFDFYDFFDFVEKIDISKVIDSQYHSQQEFIVLQRIITDIQKAA